MEFPSGEYRVAVIWIDPNAADRSNLTNRLPAKYVRPATSGLMATVTAGPTHVLPFRRRIKMPAIKTASGSVRDEMLSWGHHPKESGKWVVRVNGRPLH